MKWELLSISEYKKLIPIVLNLIWGTTLGVSPCAWAGETYYASFSDFRDNRQFYVVYCVTLAYVVVLFSKNF